MKQVDLLVVFVLGILAYVLCIVYYPYTLLWTEGNSLFLQTEEYIRSVLCEPMGLTQWIANYLIQYFRNAWSGALVYAFLFCLVSLSGRCWIRRVMSRDARYEWAVYAGVWAMAFLTFPHVEQLVSLSFFFILANLYHILRRWLIARLCLILLVPACSLWLIPWGAGLCLNIWFFSWEYRVGKSRQILLLVALGLGLHVLFPWIWSDAIGFIPYDKRSIYSLLQKDGAWDMLGYIYFLILLHVVHRLPRCKAVYSYPLLLFGVAAVCFVWVTDANRRSDEQLFTWAELAEQQQWRKLQSSLQENVGNNDAIRLKYALLAESALGTLPDNLFLYPINNPEDFLFRHEQMLYYVNFNRLFYQNVEVWDEAFHMAFEYGTQTDNGMCFKSLRNMTDCALRTRDWSIAEKYLKLLSTSSLHSSWVEERTLMLQQGKSSQKDSTGMVVQDRSDTFVGGYPFNSEMVRLFEHGTMQQKVYDYLLCGLLLKKDVENFITVLRTYPRYTGKELPRSYAEAVSMMAIRDTTLRSLGRYDVQLEQKFYAGFLQMKTQQVVPDFHGTYWNYYLFTELLEQH